MVILPLLISPLLTPSPPQNADTTLPPGLVYLVGGRTTIGSTVKEIEALVKDEGEAKAKVRALDGETPQHEVTVSAFHMGLTEVTNEQYAAFVRATGHRPPLAWADAAIEEARIAFFDELEIKRQAGQDTKGQKFDEIAFWEKNWQGKSWAINEGDELRPVTRVDYQDATAFCHWAGLRLPTEFEYQHAARGNSKDPYPWGDVWEDGVYCATREIRRVSRTFKVGDFPKGDSRDGIHDLAGNVWEWTQSPYLAFPGFKKNQYKIPGSRQKYAVPQPTWDGNQRVVVGGSYENSKMVARSTVRRGSERSQMTHALGFRVAATPIPVKDLVDHVWMRDLRNTDARPPGVSYTTELVMGQDRWDVEPGTEGAPEGYQVITNYEFLAFVPVTDIQITGDIEFGKASLIAPQHLGFLTLSMPVIEPALAPGTYLIAYRGPGKTEVEEVKPPKDAQDPPPKRREKPEDPLAALIDINVPNLLLFDALSGELAAGLPVKAPIFAKSDGSTGFHPVDKPKVIPDPDDPEETITIQERWLRIKGEVNTRTTRRVLPFQLDLKMEPEYWEKKFRKR